MQVIHPRALIQQVRGLILQTPSHLLQILRSFHRRILLGTLKLICGRLKVSWKNGQLA